MMQTIDITALFLLHIIYEKILTSDNHMMAIITHDANNHARCQQQHAMSMATCGASKTHSANNNSTPGIMHGVSNSTRCQQSHTMPAITSDANNHRRCQQLHEMPTITNDPGIFMGRFLL